MFQRFWSLQLKSDCYSILNLLNTNATGNSGNIKVTADSVTLTDGSFLDASTFGQGNAGSITIKANDFIILESNSRLFNNVELDAVGNSGGISLQTGTLSLSGESQIRSDLLGRGDTGEISVQANDSVSLVGSSTPSSFNLSTSISSRIAPRGIGSSSNILINTGSLELSGARISTSIFGEGNAGKISLQTKNFISLENSIISSNINPGVIGNSDGININTGSLSIIDGSQILSIVRGASDDFTSESRNAGDIVINATDAVNISGINSDDFRSLVATSIEFGGMGNAGNIKITARELSVTERARIRSALDGNAEGRAGNIDIQVDKLLLDSRAQLITSTFGRGDTGNVFIRATDSVFLSNGAAILSTTGSGAIGNGSEINVNTRSLSLTKGAKMRTLIDPAFNNRPSGQGNAGNININAKDTVIFAGVSTDIKSGVSQGAVGNGGDINILARSVLIANSAELSASTSGEGIAGDIDIIGTQSLNILNEARVTAEANNSSTAGNLELETGKLTIADGASVTVSSPEGLAGNLNIKANSLSQNQGQITAETGVSVGDVGANINLQISDLWILENESKVSATAFGIADGGNIDIDTEFIVAFPNQNNDIIANAFEGKGGNIDITAEGIFGIEERSSTPTNETNDIDASSEFGLSGTVNITQPDVNPTSGLLDLTQEVVNASDLIAQNVCTQTANSEFVDIGKGGLPQNPEYALVEDATEVGLVSPVTVSGEEIEAKRETGEVKPQKTLKPPAQGWIFHENGIVELVAYNPDRVGDRRTRNNYRGCQLDRNS